MLKNLVIDEPIHDYLIAIHCGNRTYCSG